VIYEDSLQGVNKNVFMISDALFLWTVLLQILHVKFAFGAAPH
jgi:hypothetical protein